MAPGSIPLGRLMIDPARYKELVDPEFIPNPLLAVTRCRCGKVSGVYDALPASLASDPSVVGCLFGRDENAAAALVAIVWDDGVARFHDLEAPDVARTNTVAGRGSAASRSPDGLTSEAA